MKKFIFNLQLYFFTVSMRFLPGLDDDSKYLDVFSFATLLYSFLWLFFFPCQTIQCQVRNLGNFREIHDFKIYLQIEKASKLLLDTPECVYDTKLFFIKLHHDPPDIKVFNYFPCNFKSLFVVYSIIFSYMITMFQFELDSKILKNKKIY